MEGRKAAFWLWREECRDFYCRKGMTNAEKSATVDGVRLGFSLALEVGLKFNSRSDIN